MPDVDRASQPNLKRISRGPRFKTIVLPEDDNFLDSSPSAQNDDEVLVLRWKIATSD